MPWFLIRSLWEHWANILPLAYLFLLLGLFIRSRQLGEAFVFKDRAHFPGRFIAFLLVGAPEDRGLKGLLWATRVVVVALAALLLGFVLMVFAAPTCVRMGTC